MSTDKSYQAGYEDGLEQNGYISDYQVDDVKCRLDYDNKVMFIEYQGDNGLVLLSRTMFEELITGIQEPGWQAEFVQQ